MVDLLYSHYDRDVCRAPGAYPETEEQGSHTPLKQYRVSSALKRAMKTKCRRAVTSTRVLLTPLCASSPYAEAQPAMGSSETLKVK